VSEQPITALPEQVKVVVSQVSPAPQLRWTLHSPVTQLPSTQTWPSAHEKSELQLVSTGGSIVVVPELAQALVHKAKSERRAKAFL
jgi:hypothetical protein